ncbi:MAG: hypothetical protein KDI60_17660 [Xanthomonadales bacterium]|nr:hypothetical protein [Xanthomonadales bacterium]
MFAIASTLSGLQGASLGNLDLAKALKSLVDGKHALDVDTAAALLIQWVAGQLKGLDNKPAGPASDLLQRINVQVPVSAAVGKLLESAGFEKLLGQLVDLQDEWLGGDEAPFLFRVSDGLPTLTRLKDIVGTTPVRFGFSFDDKNTLGSADGLKLAIKGEASATVEIRVPTPESLKEEYGLDSFALNRAAVVLVGTGELGAGADWSLEPAVFSASASFSRELAAAYDFPDDLTSVRALDAMAKSIPQSLDPKSINDVIAVPGEDGLKLIQIDRARGFSFALGLEKGLSFVDVRSVRVDGKESPINLGAALAFKLGVTHQDQRLRRLQISRPASGGLTLRSTQAESAETGVSVGLDAGFTITGWGDIANSLVQSNLPEAEDLLKKLGPAAAPGKWLRDEIEEALSGLPDGLKPLAGLITGELDSKQAQSQLATRIHDLLNSRVSLWTAVVEKRLEGLAQSLAEQLTPLASLKPTRTELAAALIAGFRRVGLLTKAGDTLKALIPTTAKPIGALTNLLGKVGYRVNTAASKANQLLDPVLAFLRDYDAFRAKLIGGADRIAKLRFGIAIDHSRHEVAADTLITEFLIPSSELGTPAARADFEAWVTGGRFGDSRLPFGVPQTNEAWRVISTRTSESTTTVRLDLAIADATTEDLLKSDTRVEVGPGGVLVALTRAAAKKLARNSWSDEVVTASGAVFLDALSPSLPTSALSLDLEFEDSRFQEKELVSILTSLERLGGSAFPASASNSIWNDWEVVRKKQGAKAPKAKLRIGMVIDQPQRRRLLELGKDEASRRALLVQALLHATPERPERNVVDALAVLGYEHDPADVLVREWNRFAGWLRYKGTKKAGQIIVKENLPGISSIGSPVSRAVEALWGAAHVVNAIESVLLFAANWPAADDAIETLIKQALGSRPDLQDYEAAFLASKQLADEYARKGRDVSRAMGRALSASDAMFDGNDGAPVNTLILMSFLSGACGARLVGEVVDAS